MLQVDWVELIGEPDHTRSIDCVWKFSFKCFNLWKTLCYLILSTLCSIIISMCWGCYFACVAFMHIWCCIPGIKAIEVNCGLLGKCLTIFTTNCMDPCFEACGKCFSAFKK